MADAAPVPLVGPRDADDAGRVVPVLPDEPPPPALIRHLGDLLLQLLSVRCSRFERLVRAAELPVGKETGVRFSVAVHADLPPVRGVRVDPDDAFGAGHGS